MKRRSTYYRIYNDCARLRPWHAEFDVVKITGDKTFDLDLPARRSMLLKQEIDFDIDVVSVGKTKFDKESWKSSIIFYYTNPAESSIKQAVISCQDWEITESLRLSLIAYQCNKLRIQRNIAEMIIPPAPLRS
jgi:hypothetical protein